MKHINFYLLILLISLNSCVFYKGKSIYFKDIEGNSIEMGYLRFSQTSPLASYTHMNHNGMNIPCQYNLQPSYVWNMETGEHILIGNDSNRVYKQIIEFSPNKNELIYLATGSECSDRPVVTLKSDWLEGKREFKWYSRTTPARYIGTEGLIHLFNVNTKEDKIINKQLPAIAPYYWEWLNDSEIVYSCHLESNTFVYVEGGIYPKTALCTLNIYTQKMAKSQLDLKFNFEKPRLQCYNCNRTGTMKIEQRRVHFDKNFFYYDMTHIVYSNGKKKLIYRGGLNPVMSWSYDNHLYGLFARRGKYILKQYF